MKCKVYEIINTETGLPVYVGSSGNMEGRIRNHRNGHTQATKDFFKKFPKAKFFITAEFDDQYSAIEYEEDLTRFYVFDKEYDLLNIDFGNKHSEATKKKMSEASINPSEETRRKMSESKTGNKHPRFDHTIHNFFNKKTCETRTTTQYSLRTEFNLHRGSLSNVCTGKRKSHHGWTKV